MIQILEESRAQFIVRLGYGDKVNIKEGTGFILGDLSITFKNQAHYGQNLKIDMAATDLKAKSFDIVYKVSIQGTGEEVARAKTAILVFDYYKQ